MEEDTTKTERSGKKPKKRAPRDPAGRRQAIIDAAANLIAREGSSKITNRRVAEEAGVPLGSTTQYFKSIDDPLYHSILLLELLQVLQTYLLYYSL